MQLGNPLKGLLCVGIAYFLIGIIVPIVGLSALRLQHDGLDYLLQPPLARSARYQSHALCRLLLASDGAAMVL